MWYPNVYADRLGKPCQPPNRQPYHHPPQAVKHKRPTRPADISHLPFRALPPGTSHVFIRAKPQSSHHRCQSQRLPSSSRGHQPLDSNHSLLIDVMRHQDAYSRYDALIRAIEKAADEQFSRAKFVKVRRVWAVWNDGVCSSGGRRQQEQSQTVVTESNVAGVLGLVAQGSPLTYLVFEFGFKDGWGRDVGS
ncbi:MAG: hypothetical protein M1831_006102 [Alyxoria varia]|nr:MAG: hypothetical protein M1831_006102 [Alyxoria varia]